MRQPQCLRCQLQGEICHHFGDHSQKNAAILQLPLDILLLILDNLALHDKFLLAHTCKAFRQITTDLSWYFKISSLPSDDKFRFCVGLAYTLPNRWACPKCCKLHPINTLDTPATCVVRRELRIPCGVDLSRKLGVEVYSVEYHHIQFALKLSRLGNTYHQPYLAKLLDTYTDTRTSLLNPFTQTYTAEPRIIAQQFIFREEWNINKSTNAISPLFAGDGIYHLQVCPHLGLQSSDLGYSRSRKRWTANAQIHLYNIQRRLLGIDVAHIEEMTLFQEMTLIEDGIGLAYDSPGQWEYNSCPYCATDFGIMISTDGRKATIQAWHNFGTEGSPMDISWRANVANQTPTWLALSPYLDYTHGGVRKLWLEDISN